MKCKINDYPFIFTLFVLIAMVNLAFSQEQRQEKSSWFFYWGWNNAAYTKSDIDFKGEHYQFSLDKVVAHDRQSPFNLKLYLNPKTITIPQYNIRLGYHFSDRYAISIGTDHMKYVADSNQIVRISGRITQTGTIYDRDYDADTISLKRGFLLFEHTDGLNYINADLRRRLWKKNIRSFTIDAYAGAGIGILFPRTNTTLLNYKRYDEFHVAGFGSHIMISPRILWKKHFFIQSELKFGFIDMPDIRTTEFKTDRAKQHFLFIQSNYLFGWRFIL